MQFTSNLLVKPTLLHEQNGLVLSVSRQADPQTIALLTQTLYGTDGIQYRQTGQAHRIGLLSDPLFFQLYDSRQTLIGLYCLDKRPVGFRGELVPAYYGRYLAVSADQQGKGFGQLLKATAIEYVQARQSAPHLFYSYIEAKNTRSMAASKQTGFTSVAQLSTYLFRRFTPRPDQRVRPLQPVESALAHQLVANQYARYGFQHFTHINAQRPFFVLEERGRVVAGAQVSPIQWGAGAPAGATGFTIAVRSSARAGPASLFQSRQSVISNTGRGLCSSRPSRPAGSAAGECASPLQHPYGYVADR